MPKFARNGRSLGERHDCNDFRLVCGGTVRRDQPLHRPGTPSETIGDADLGVNNVVFICAAHFFEGDVYFPYAGADSVVLGGCIRKAELNKYLGVVLK
jgi:predicted GH43/DUF377 family glycosyl hydrolase